MTNKAALGLMGGSGLATGLGTGYGVGINIKPFDYRNFMNSLYANLIKDARAKVNTYDSNKTDSNEKDQILKDYVSYVCSTVTKIQESYGIESTKDRMTSDKDLCSNLVSDADLGTYKSQWETHFRKWPENLEKEWIDFIKHINNSPE